METKKNKTQSKKLFSFFKQFVVHNEVVFYQLLKFYQIYFNLHDTISDLEYEEIMTILKKQADNLNTEIDQSNIWLKYKYSKL